MRPRLAGTLGGGLLCLLANAQAGISTGIDPESGLPFWELREPDMSLRLGQRLPDQTRAFFMARGFAGDTVERVAQRCVFQTVFKNLAEDTAAGTLEYDLHDWTVRSAGRAVRMLTREFWAAEWAALAIARPARIAFEWALFPTRQTYHSGDYNWGMSVFDLPPGSRFDLTVVWHQSGVRRSARMDGIECAPATSPHQETP